jgi:FkbM family methyltransferase
VKDKSLLSDLPDTLKPSKRSLSKATNFEISNIARRYSLDIESVCHVGAHKGAEIDEYLMLGIKLGIFIEPIPESFQSLSEAIKGLPNYRAVNVAVGNKESIVDLNLATNDFQSSSVLKPKIHLKEAPNVKFNSKISVEVKRLDNILEHSVPWDLIVIDVQGYELEVLKGAIQTLKHSSYIFIEVNRDETYEGCAQIGEIDKFLNDIGFHRVLTRWWSSWGDALYVRKKLLPIRASRL